MTALVALLTDPDTNAPVLCVIADESGATHLFPDGDTEKGGLNDDRVNRLLEVLRLDLPTDAAGWLKVALRNMGQTYTHAPVEAADRRAATKVARDLMDAAAENVRPIVDRRAQSAAASANFDEWASAEPEAADAMYDGEEVDPSAMNRLMILQQGPVHPDEPHRWLPEELGDIGCWACGMDEDWPTHQLWAAAATSA